MAALAKQWQHIWAIWDSRKLAVIFGVVYLALSLFAMAHFLNSSFLGERYFKTTFQGMYDGTTFKPFVYRQLIPSLARGITAVSPRPLQDMVNQAVQSLKTDPDLATLRVILPWIDRAFPVFWGHYPRIVATLLIYASLWGYIWALMALTRQLFPLSPAMAYFAPVFGILAISSFSWPFQYVYDIPVLFLSTACYYCIAARRWKSYLLFFTLACWNKETAIFIFLFFVIWCFRRMDRRSYVNLMLVQYVIYALIRIWLLYIYEDNTGQYLKNHLFRVLPNDLFTTSYYERILNIALMFFLLTYQWSKKPAFLKCGLWLLPPMYLAYLLYGMPGEYRVFFDILPLQLLLGVHTLVEATGLARASVFERARRLNEDKGNKHGALH